MKNSLGIKENIILAVSRSLSSKTVEIITVLLFYTLLNREHINSSYYL